MIWVKGIVFNVFQILITQKQEYGLLLLISHCALQVDFINISKQ